MVVASVPSRQLDDDWDVRPDAQPKRRPEAIMSAKRQHVISSTARSDVMPEYGAEYCLMINDFERAELGEGLAPFEPVRRAGACDIFGLISFLIAYFCSNSQRGLHYFDDHLGAHRTQFAGIGDRKTLASQSSISRALANISMEQATGIAKILRDASLADSHLIGHEFTVWRDALNNPRVVLDLDPQGEAFRQRKLPRGADLPEPERLSEDFAKAGHLGRKRGDVVMHYCRTQIAGSGLWAGLTVHSGNVKLSQAISAVLQDTVDVCASHGAPKQALVMRIDGQGGNVPCILALQNAGMDYVTRSAHYKILQDPDVIEYMRTGHWDPVPCSLSGPQRMALELGHWTLHAATKTRAADGELCSPVHPRMVVTRYEPTDPTKKNGAGILMDGLHYELFAAHADAQAWPAPELVGVYFGRAELENRFAQENRELGLNHMFSKHLPGQLVAAAVGNWVWNRRTQNGAILANLAAANAFVRPPAEVWAAPAELPPRADAGLLCGPCAAADPPQAPAKPLSESSSADLDWERALENYPDFKRIGDSGVTCPAKHTLRLHSRKDRGKRGISLVFRAKTSQCRVCPLRDRCTTSQDPDFKRQIRLHLRPLDSVTPPAAAKTEAPRRAPPVWPPKACATAHHAVRPPQLIPAKLRALTVFLLALVETHVRVTVPTQSFEIAPYLAKDAARRQRRRYTYAERRAMLELDAAAHVRIEFREAGRARGLLERAGGKMLGNRLNL